MEGVSSKTVTLRNVQRYVYFNCIKGKRREKLFEIAIHAFTGRSSFFSERSFTRSRGTCTYNHVFSYMYVKEEKERERERAREGEERRER